MIVVGVDPSKFGYHAAVISGVGTEDETLTLHHYSAENKREFQLPSAILAKVHIAAMKMLYAIGRTWPDEEIAVFCEEAVSAGLARNLRTYGQLAMSVGAIMSATTIYTPKCYLVPVSKWKQVVVGKGNVGKDQVALWLNRVHPNYSLECAGRQDLIDACCIARYGISLFNDSLLVAVDSAGEV